MGARLRRKGLSGTTVTLRIKDSHLALHSAQCRLSKPTQDEHDFGPTALGLLDGLWHEGQPVRLVGVGISGFGDEAAVQGTLFESDGEDSPTRDLAALSRATDAVRERFGTGVIAYGRDFRLKEITSDTMPMNKDRD